MPYLHPRVVNSAAGLTRRRVLLGTFPSARSRSSARLGTLHLAIEHICKCNHVTPPSKPAESNNGRHYRTQITSGQVLWGIICFSSGYVYMSPSDMFVKTKFRELFAKKKEE